MQRFKKILFINQPVAKSETALHLAIELAQKNDAKLTIANIIESSSTEIKQYQSILKKIQQDELQTYIKNLDFNQANINSLCLTGKPFFEIIKQVLRNDFDLVIKPSEGDDGLSNMLFGTTDMHLFRKCPCPVWIIKDRNEKQYTRILAAVDPAPEPKENEELNHLILDLATSLASNNNSELHIVHGWKMMYESKLRNSRPYLPKKEIDEMVFDIKNSHIRWFDDLISQYDLTKLSIKSHLLKGEPSDIITSLAKKERIDLIVMGTVARTGITGFFIGNTAEKIINDIDCSILAVKPSTFQTPVKKI